jgi:CheY-like chemotaxis protein
MSGLALDTQLTNEQREFIETIRVSGDALLTIINDILDFSKIEAGKMDLEEQPFNLRECLESAIDLIAFKASEIGLELGCVIESGVPEATIGDVTRLRQIIVNLLSNAVKFTKQGEVVLSVEMAREQPLSAHTRLLHFSVRDTGIGIPADRMDRMFKSFSQVDSSTTRKYGGTGLGLVISKKLAEMMGGEMWVESTEGVGSTFHFTIYAQTANLQRAEQMTAIPQFAGKHLLILNDNKTNCRILSLQTQAWKMTSVEFSDPQEVVASIKRGDAYDLAILDMQMSKMSAAQLAQEIRAHNSSLPLVILAPLGYHGSEDTSAFSAFISKPIKQYGLYGALVTALSLQAADTKRAASAESKFDSHMAERHPLKILLAEDNAVNQKLATQMLKRMGYRADVAGNGLEVLEALGRQPYDVIFMDVQMPEMDGIEATRSIRSLANISQPRIIAMTANAMQGDREECLAAGMDDYVSKPIRVTELIGALEKC